jgi:hypothetical protein
MIIFTKNGRGTDICTRNARPERIPWLPRRRGTQISMQAYAERASHSLKHATCRVLRKTTVSRGFAWSLVLGTTYGKCHHRERRQGDHQTAERPW